MDADRSDRQGPGGRPFLGVMFECCSIYQRIYRDRSGQAYRGRCPRCLRSVVVPVGDGGSDTRFLRAR